MSIRIDCNKKEILRVKNSIFGSLHDAIIDIIEQQHLSIGNAVENLLKKTDQNIYGSGAVTADIVDYIKTKEDALIFANLVKQAIKKEYADQNISCSCIDHLWEFYNKLIEYADQLLDK